MNQKFEDKTFTNNRNIGVVQCARRQRKIFYLFFPKWRLYMNDMIGLWYKTKIEMSCSNYKCGT